MNLITNIKNKIIVLSFTLFIFFWSFNIYGSFPLRYFILIPFIFLLYEKKNILKINFKYFLILPIILLLHYILTNYINSTSFYIRDFLGIIFLSIIIFTFLTYRDLIHNQFKNILKIYFIALIFFSLIFERSTNIGSCSSSFYSLFPILKILPFSKGFFLENSHLAMMNIAAIISSTYICLKKIDYFLLVLLVFSLIINILNLSTTFILGYIICSILFFFITNNKYFKVILFICSLVFYFIIYQSYDCSKKVSFININNIKQENIKKGEAGGLTSTIYERSIILSLRTLKNNPLGWGFDGTIKATNNYLKEKKEKTIYTEENTSLNFDSLISKLNLRDALGNIFKLIIEFGYLNIILFFLFINYLKKNKISEFEIFIISLFVVQLFRGAGYINGGFILAFAEIFLSNFFIINNHRLKMKFPNSF